MLTSYAFSPRTSICSKNTAIDSSFICPLYRGRVAPNYRVLYIVAVCPFTAFFQRCFYLLSAYLAIHIVDLYLCQQPPILYRRSGALLAQYWFSAWCYRSSYISCSFSIAYRRRVSQLISLGVVPLQGALIPYIQSSIQRISFSIGQFYTIDTLLYSGCFYIYIYQQYYYFAFQYSIQYSFISPYNSIQILVLQFLQ